MPDTKRITCRTHGGIFNYPIRSGRQPVKCRAEYLCDQAVVEAAATVTSVVRDVPGVGKVAVLTGPRTKQAESNGAARSADNPSLALAMAAKEQLVNLGWVVQGKADGAGGASAEIQASRGAETLIMRWSAGKVVTQDYSLEYEKPSLNGIPGRKLAFDPEELTDRELVDRIKGMTVTWWNTLANSTETGTIGNKVAIEHLFDGDNTKRLVKFIDHSGRGFRAFHVSALMKVG